MVKRTSLSVIQPEMIVTLLATVQTYTYSKVMSFKKLCLCIINKSSVSLNCVLDYLTFFKFSTLKINYLLEEG